MEERQGAPTPAPKEVHSRTAILVTILVAIVALVLIFVFGFNPLSKSTSTSTNEAGGMDIRTEQNQSATLSVVTDKDTYIVGDDIKIDIVLNTKAKVSGVDIVLTFTDVIEVAQIKEPDENALNQTASAYLQTAQSAFTDFPFMKIEEEGNNRIVRFSGISAPRETFSGEGVVATLLAKARKAGETQIGIVFEGTGIPTDTNVAFEGKDILTKVEGKSITITE
jgi:hypothetical protein